MDHVKGKWFRVECVSRFPPYLYLYSHFSQIRRHLGSSYQGRGRGPPRQVHSPLAAEGASGRWRNQRGSGRGRRDTCGSSSGDNTGARCSKCETVCCRHRRLLFRYNHPLPLLVRFVHVHILQGAPSIGRRDDRLLKRRLGAVEAWRHGLTPECVKLLLQECTLLLKAMYGDFMLR